MTTRIGLAMLAALLFAPLAARAQPAAPAVLPDAEIRRILVERVDTQKQSVGIVAGVIEPAGRRVVSYGRTLRAPRVP